jgi:D-aminoacyl-tRNA deacylase
MKIVLQRVVDSYVEIDHIKTAEIKRGYLLLLGFEKGDDNRFINPMIDKIMKICLFPDEKGRFSHSLVDVGGSLLIVSQFTLFADLKKGKKPSLSRALSPDAATCLYNDFIEEAKNRKIKVQTGEFGANMQVVLQNDGPVTIILDSRELFPSLYS